MHYVCIQLFSVSFLSMGVALTYFAVKHSFGLTIVTLGLVFGLGVGVAYAVPMAVGMRVRLSKTHCK